MWGGGEGMGERGERKINTRREKEVCVCGGGGG